jgi:hypothetical protein
MEFSFLSVTYELEMVPKEVVVAQFELLSRTDV